MRSEGFFTTSDGVSLWWGLAGNPDGPAFVLCDGIACDGFIWPHVMDYFHERMNLVRWHYRGHGRSGAPEDPAALTLPRMADDLAELLDHLGLTDVVIAGHSMGVQLALEAYRRHPQRIRALCLVCGSYGRPLSTFGGTNIGEAVLPWVQTLAAAAPWVTDQMWRKLLPTQLSYRIAQVTELNASRVRREEFFPYLQHAARMDPRVFLGMLTHVAEHDAGDMLESIAVPTLVVAGGHDGFTPGALSRDMAELIPRGELLMLAEGTHTAPLEFPDAVNARLQRFFEDHGILAG